MLPSNECLTERRLTRRTFIRGASGAALGRALFPRSFGAAAPPMPPAVGVNTSSFARQIRAVGAGRIDPFDIPNILRSEVDVRGIDLVHNTLGTRELAVMARFRERASAAGCVVTNLKVNENSLALDSREVGLRRAAIDEYRRWVDAAVELGARWLRPFPSVAKPDWASLVAGYRELGEYAKPRGITLLIENYRWVEKDPDAVPRLVAALPGLVAAQPDTGNWADEAIRRRGLSLAFPHALSADFKVHALDNKNEHAAYDLRAAFEIGWRAGFRGPWCIEHVHAERATLLRELRVIADRLKRWMAEAARG